MFSNGNTHATLAIKNPHISWICNKIIIKTSNHTYFEFLLSHVNGGSGLLPGEVSPPGSEVGVPEKGTGGKRGEGRQ